MTTDELEAHRLRLEHELAEADRVLTNAEDRLVEAHGLPLGHPARASALEAARAAVHYATEDCHALDRELAAINELECVA